MFVTTIKELHEKLKAESDDRAKRVNVAAVMNLDNIKNNTNDHNAHESLLYLRGLLVGLYIGSYINAAEYDALRLEVDKAYHNR